MEILKKKIVLASASPRRSALLAAAGFECVSVRYAMVDETWPPEMAPEEVPEYLAVKKAGASAHLLEDPTELLVAADSVVILDGRIFGKPVDRPDACRMLAELSGKAHQVVTGVCLLTQNRRHTFRETTKVRFRPVTSEEIEYYVDRYKPYDKAGSYGIQEWLGWCKVEALEGSYANVMGLPVERLYHELNNF
ncbi:MAG: hypothetical protein RLY31_1552 [Bacteroidota bacterium]|jgi:septum formation protein